MSSPYKRVTVKDLLNDESNSPSMNTPNLTRHADGIPNIRCDINSCGQKFATLDSLQAHQRRKHAAPTSFVCPQCMSSYSSLPNLKKHVRFQVPAVTIMVINMEIR